MLFYCTVNCLCTAKQLDTVILVNRASLLQPQAFPHPRLFWYSGTPWSEVAALSHPPRGTTSLALPRDMQV